MILLSRHGSVRKRVDYETNNIDWLIDIIKPCDSHRTSNDAKQGRI
jgi:hypothetical protein